MLNYGSYNRARANALPLMSVNLKLAERWLGFSDINWNVVKIKLIYMPLFVVLERLHGPYHTF
jgi:hypothetical protein